MFGLLLFQILLLGISGSQGQDCNCEPCKHVPYGSHEGFWDIEDVSSTRCPLKDDPTKFGCLYSKYNSTGETMCFCDPGLVSYDTCFFTDTEVDPNGIAWGESEEKKECCPTCPQPNEVCIGYCHPFGCVGVCVPDPKCVGEDDAVTTAPVSPCFTKKCTITKGTKKETLPTLGKLFHISFNVTPTNYVNASQSVIHFTTGSQTVKIPAMYAEYVSSTAGKLKFCNSDISSTCTTTTLPTYPVNAAIPIVFQQLLVQGQHQYQVYINGDTTPFVNEPNPTPVAYSNVEVYISDPWNPALGGTISNLCINPTSSTAGTC